jgi:ubiquitin carboxyl-terminal hydrolase 5/13
LDQKRFKTYPKVMAIVLQRFVLDGWTPKKLLIELQFNPESLFDFTKYGEPVICAGQPMPESAEESGETEVEPELDANIVNQLLQMSIPECQAKHAVYNTGNCSADMAVAWFFENMEDPLIQLPLRVKK